MKISHLDVKAAFELISENPDILVIDVRTAEEFEMSYIEKAVNYDFQGAFFKHQLSEMDREKEYLIHCHSGQRSTDALKTFKELGFTHIYHMDGGMREWAHADLPTVYNWFI